METFMKIYTRITNKILKAFVFIQNLCYYFHYQGFDKKRIIKIIMNIYIYI